MSIAVMVGGPLHGQSQRMPDPPPAQWLVPRPVEIGPLDFNDDPSFTMPEPGRYELRWYNGRRPWDIKPERLPAYLWMSGDDAARPPLPRNEDEGFYVAAADSIWHQIMEERLPVCIVPECTDKGRLVFTAAEDGRLAGREWTRGDEIRVCPKHGHDIYLAAGARGMEQLAEWIRPDAKLDALEPPHLDSQAGQEQS